jgi:hypothetical protein
MNSIINEVLSDPTLRSAEALTASLVETASAGTPWLTED